MKRLLYSGERLAMAPDDDWVFRKIFDGDDLSGG